MKDYLKKLRDRKPKGTMQEIEFDLAIKANALKQIIYSLQFKN